MKVYRKDKISDIERSPGVYQFVDKNGDVLYIGKAKDLKNRIKSYFALEIGRGPAIDLMVRQAVKIKIYETESEIEAVILEAELIKKIRPKYNVALKDDKSFLMIKITKEDFPCVTTVRFKDYQLAGDKVNTYFGPYPAGELLKRSLKYLRKVFPYRDCSKTKYATCAKKGQACLYGDIRVCSGPCAEWVDKRAYNKNITFLKNILRGRKKQIYDQLVKEMTTLSKNKEFERAAIVRNKVYGMNHLNEVALGLRDDRFESSNIMFKRIECFDISNISGQYNVGSMSVIQDGKPDTSEYRKFRIRGVDAANDVAAMREVLQRRLANDWPEADLFVVDGGLVHLNLAREILKRAKIEKPVVSIAKGPKRDKNEFHYSDQAIAKYCQKSPELVKSIILARDEAHRFAIQYYRKLHSEDMINA